MVIQFITGRNEVLAKVIFLHLSVILFTGGGGWVSAPNFRGGGVCSKFSGGSAPNFRGGVCSKFSGGVSAPNFRGVSAPNFGGVSAPNFWGGVCGPGLVPKGGVPPIFGIRSPFGRYLSYWNAFLFVMVFILGFSTGYRQLSYQLYPFLNLSQISQTRSHLGYYHAIFIF